MAKPELIDDVDVMLGDFPSLITEDGSLNQDQIRELNFYLKAIVQKLNGRISFGTGVQQRRGNIDGQFVDINTPDTADTLFSIPHNIGRVPVGFLVVWRDNEELRLYCSETEKKNWTETSLQLKTPNTGGKVYRAKLFVF